MSCVHFLSPAAQKQLAKAQNEKLSYSSPKVSAAKLRRLHKMAQSPNEDIRAAAAGNTMLPVDMIDRLVRDPSAKVRGWLARNPAVDEWTLIELCDDSDRSIAAFAQWRLDALDL